MLLRKELSEKQSYYQVQDGETKESVHMKQKEQERKIDKIRNKKEVKNRSYKYTLRNVPQERRTHATEA
jgi:uncharacterized membrane protein